MTDFLARNWVLVLVLGGMAFMHFGMHRGHGESGHGGGCGGGRANEGHEQAAPTRHESDTPVVRRDRTRKEPWTPHWGVRRTPQCPSTPASRSRTRPKNSVLAEAAADRLAGVDVVAPRSRPEC